MVKNCLVSETQKFARAYGLSIPSDQARMMDGFLNGKTPLVAYTNIRQSGKTTLGKVAALYHALKFPKTIVGIKGFKMMHTHNIIRFIAEGVPEEFIDFADRDRIIFVNGSIIMAATTDNIVDVAINDEAPMFDDLIKGREKTFSYGTWGTRDLSCHKFREFTLRADVEFFAMDDVGREQVLQINEMGNLEWATTENYVVDHSILNIINTTGIEQTPTITADTVNIEGEEYFVGDDWARQYYID